MAKFCIHCGTPIKENNAFCTNCGKPTKAQRRPKPSPQSKPPLSTPQPTHISPKKAQTPVKTKPRPKKSKLPWIAGLLILAIIFVMIKKPFNWPDSPETGYDPIPTTPTQTGSQAEGITLAPVTFDPSPLVLSGSQAFTLEPMEGVTLSAPENALDKDRKFTVTPLATSELEALANQDKQYNFVPLAGINLDSGMEPGEIFPGDMTLTMDLAAFNIDESLYDDLCVIRIDNGGNYAWLSSQVSDGSITFKSEQNCVYILGLSSHFWIALAIGSTVVLPALAVTYDTLKKEGYMDDDWSFDTDLMMTGWLDIKEVDGYTIYYPARMTPANPTEVKRVTDTLISILENHQITPTASSIKLLMKSPKTMSSLWSALKKDQDFLEVQKLLEDRNWRLNNLYPEEVSITVSQLEKAHAYLFNSPEKGGRGFKSYNSMDVILYDKWPSDPDNIAESRNPISKQPYIMINAQAAPVAGSSAMKDWSDHLLPGLTHELFHTSQVRYLGTFSIDRLSDLWFWEATAIAVEKQARTYFEDNLVIPHDDMIISQQNMNYCQENLAYPNGYDDPLDLQNQGYANGMLIEYIGRLYANQTGKSQLDYIPYALTKYAELRDARNTLFATSTGTSYGFEGLYKNFCQLYIEEFHQGYGLAKTSQPSLPSPINLSKENPTATLTKTYDSLSADFQKISVTDMPEGVSNSVRMVIRAGVGNLTGLVNGYCLTAMTTDSDIYQEVLEPSNMTTDFFDAPLAFGTAANNNSLYLQGVNYNADKSFNPTYTVFAMYEPQPAVLSFNKITDAMWNLSIELTPTSLWDLGYVDTYEVVIACPNGDRYTLTTSKAKLDLNTTYNRDSLNESIYANDDISHIEVVKAGPDTPTDTLFRLSYCERTNTDAKVNGPYTATASLKVSETVRLTGDASNLYPYEEINYQVTITPSKDNYTYHWVVGDLLDQEGTDTLTLSFDQPGTYTATVTVSDSQGNLVGSDSHTCTVTMPESASPGAFDPDLAFFQIYKEDGTPTDYAYSFIGGYLVGGRYDQVKMYLEDGIYTESYYIYFGVYEFDESQSTYYGSIKDYGDFSAIVSGTTITFYNADGSHYATGTLLTEDRPFEYKTPTTPSDQNLMDIIPEGD